MKVFWNVTLCFGRTGDAAVRTNCLSSTLAWVSFCELIARGGTTCVSPAIWLVKN